MSMHQEQGSSRAGRTENPPTAAGGDAADPIEEVKPEELADIIELMPENLFSDEEFGEFEPCSRFPVAIDLPEAIDLSRSRSPATRDEEDLDTSDEVEAWVASVSHRPFVRPETAETSALLDLPSPEASPDRDIRESKTENRRPPGDTPAQAYDVGSGSWKDQEIERQLASGRLGVLGDSSEMVRCIISPPVVHGIESSPLAIDPGRRADDQPTARAAGEENRQAASAGVMKPILLTDVEFRTAVAARGALETLNRLVEPIRTFTTVEAVTIPGREFPV